MTSTPAQPIVRLRGLTTQFFLTCMVITVSSLVLISIFSARLYSDLYVRTIMDDASARVFLLRPLLTPLVQDTMRFTSVDSLCKNVGRAVSTRVTVILPSGKVIGDSETDPLSMDNHSTRPEFINAVSHGRGVQQRFSTTLHQNMLYVAEPIGPGDSVRAVLRLAVSLEQIKQHQKHFYWQVAIAAIVMLILLAGASLLLSKRLSRPIQLMKTGAERFAAGDLGFKLAIPTSDEMAGLAHALNSMAASLDNRIHTITRQRNELNAVLTGMAEGVIAIDSKERIISLNPAASQMLGLNGDSASGKWIHEIVRNSDLQKFLAQTLTSNEMVETTMVLPSSDGERHLQAHGSVLRDMDGATSGAVLVLNDVTRVRKLENMRKDFVANVSHELRTPLTSIKGFVETLQTGEYGFNAEATHFLGIIANKTDRLCSIVDDILTLSSIERDHEQEEVTLARASIKRTLEEAVKSCAPKASAKGITLSLECDPSLQGRINAQLIEQAVVNLIDNAIKYSNDGKSVGVFAAGRDGDIEIAVTDNGIGIAPEHLDRVFERFYRVDKARSRKMGGTGLGLSIVKNIAVAHGGRVSVESELNKGSTFRIHLPLEPHKES